MDEQGRGAGDDQARLGSLAQTVVEVLDAWGVPAAQQLSLLGLEGQMKPRGLIRLRNGSPLPQGRDTLRRAAALIAMYRALHTMYPGSEAAADLWVSAPNPRLGRRSPLDVMLERGVEGIEVLLGQLDGSDAWS